MPRSALPPWASGWPLTDEALEVIWLYNALLALALLLLAPVWIVWLLASPRLRRDFGERLRPLPASLPGTVWIHAASVGEVEAAVPLLEALRDRGVPLVATTLTHTGRDRLRARLPGVRVRLAPLDLPGLVHLSLRRARVTVVVLVETELWPNLIWAARGAGSELLIVSARLSDGSFRAYQRARPLFRSVLRSVSRIAARSDEDRDRFRALGVPVDRATLGGDLKLDRPAPDPPSEELLGALGRGPFLVGGSTHPGEDEALVSSWQSLREEAPELRLVLAPRHPERVPQLMDWLRRRAVPAALRSDGAASSPVVVLDTLGELPTIYGLADLVFAGGTLAPVGGHNLIEPVQAGKVVVHGPHTENQRSQVQLLDPLGVLYQIRSAGELQEMLRRLWLDPDRNAPAARAREALRSHQGATARALEIVLELRKRAGPAMAAALA